MIAKIKKRKKRDDETSLFTSALLVFLIMGFFVFLIISNVRINKERKELQARIENLKQEIKEMEKKKMSDIKKPRAFPGWGHKLKIKDEPEAVH